MTAPTPEACMEAFTAALIGRDMEAAKALLADDALLFYSNGTVLRGKAEFETMMTAAWRVVEDYRYESTDASWLVQSPTTAVVVYGFSWSGVARGQAVTGAGRATRVFRDDGSGWVLVHEHLSAGQAPAQA